MFHSTIRSSDFEIPIRIPPPFVHALHLRSRIATLFPLYCIVLTLAWSRGIHLHLRVLFIDSVLPALRPRFVSRRHSRMIILVVALAYLLPQFFSQPF
jgi:hypothetical protein